MSHREINWANVGSARYWLGSVFGAILLGAVVSYVSDPLGVATVFIALPALLYVNATSRVYRCPFCRKAVRAHATACHHCGRDVS